MCREEVPVIKIKKINKDFTICGLKLIEEDEVMVTCLFADFLDREIFETTFFYLSRKNLFNFKNIYT